MNVGNSAEAEVVAGGGAVKTKLLVILRGLPGSGRSTFAREVRRESEKNGLSCIVLSTDDYFLETGFDPVYLVRAHDWNRKRASDVMTRGKVNVVVIDNTNIRREHYEPYIRMAQMTDYEVRIETISQNASILELAKRNRHGCPAGTIDRMAKEFEL